MTRIQSSLIVLCIPGLPSIWKSVLWKKRIIQLSCSKEGCSFWSSGLCNFLCWSVISFVMVQHSWKPFGADVFSKKGFLIEQSRWPARLEGLICFDHSILYYKLLNWHPNPNPSCCHQHTMVLGVELNYPERKATTMLHLHWGSVTSGNGPLAWALTTQGNTIPEPPLYANDFTVMLLFPSLQTCGNTASPQGVYSPWGFIGEAFQN